MCMANTAVIVEEDWLLFFYQCDSESLEQAEAECGAPSTKHRNFSFSAGMFKCVGDHANAGVDYMDDDWRAEQSQTKLARLDK